MHKTSIKEYMEIGGGHTKAKASYIMSQIFKKEFLWKLMK